MADQPDSITFANVSMMLTTNAGDGANLVASFSDTTLSFTYPTTAGLENPVSGSLTFNSGGETGNVVFSNLIITEIGPNIYQLGEGNGLVQTSVYLAWNGTTPTAFAEGSVFLSPGVLGGGDAYTSFVTDTITSTCFAAGTLIRTPGGDVAVETLKVGDLVLTASGETRPVKWTGHRDVDFRRTPRGSPGLPIRIAADAFGPARPSHDLYLSAGHSVCVDLLGEVLIPVGYLVNGSAIAEIDTDAISYWHVELESHDILIANNLPAESYLAMANRGAFEELRGLLPAMIEGSERTHADFCRPVVTEGPVLDFVRRRLAARAEEIGWKPQRDADLRLTVDGRIVRPLAEDGSAAFLFRADAKDVRLMSNTFSPSALGSSDRRKLGVMLLGLALSGSGGEPRRISLHDDRLADGVHHVENHGGNLRRWTNGEFVLDPRLWEGLSGQIALHVAYDHMTVRGWIAASAPPRKVEASPKLYAVS